MRKVGTVFRCEATDSSASVRYSRDVESVCERERSQGEGCGCSFAALRAAEHGTSDKRLICVEISAVVMMGCRARQLITAATLLYTLITRVALASYYSL